MVFVFVLFSYFPSHAGVCTSTSVAAQGCTGTSVFFRSSFRFAVSRRRLARTQVGAFDTLVRSSDMPVHRPVTRIARSRRCLSASMGSADIARSLIARAGTEPLDIGDVHNITGVFGNPGRRFAPLAETRGHAYPGSFTVDSQDPADAHLRLRACGFVFAPVREGRAPFLQHQRFPSSLVARCSVGIRRIAAGKPIGTRARALKCYTLQNTVLSMYKLFLFVSNNTGF
ncbi:hypothetical protein B0H19DRAFT_1375978 [Mycena capillaripes]|nr:hypothetical protein B0H19DRAFT_1375978 [Mycena capillaripes]